MNFLQSNKKYPTFRRQLSAHICRKQRKYTNSANSLKFETHKSLVL